MAIFTSKIHCGNCKNIYIRKNDRGKFKWICQSYEEFSNCLSNIVSEEALIEFISRRFYLEDRILEKVIPFIESSVESIIVKGKNNFEVLIRGQEPMLWRPGHIQY
jgi:hypothetical protein